MKFFSRSLVGGLLSLPLVAGAESTRQLDSHAHGHASLNIAVDEGHLLIELESPAANIAGFEHKPETDEQRAVLEQAVAILQSGEGLFQWDVGAACTLEDADVEAGQLEDAHDGHADRDADEDHDNHADHDDDKDHDKHADDKEHDDHGHGDEGEVHSEFHVVWSFDCERTEALQSMVVDLFDQFPGIEELDVAVVGLNSQSAAELTADNRQLSLK